MAAALATGMSNKHFLVALVASVGLCAPAFASPRVATIAPAAPPRPVAAKPVAAKPVAARPRKAAVPDIELGRNVGVRTSLTAEQVADVVKARTADVEACWTKLPADQRKKPATAMITLEIDDDGEVQTVETAGVPDDAKRCIALAAIGWEFPRTDVKADAESFTVPVALK